MPLATVIREYGSPTYQGLAGSRPVFRWGIHVPECPP